jgi:hypothetical protein
MVPINYLAVLVAAISSMVVGSLWYGPLFGKQWMALMGVTKESMAGAKVNIGKLYAIQALASLVMAFVLAHALVFAATYTESRGIAAGLMVGFWNWLGFVAPVTLGSVLWEQKSWKLWALNNAHYVVSLCIMGVILALWQ